MRKPIIGITTSARTGWRVFPLIALSVWLAGGRAKWWRVGHDADLNSVDGVIVGGGDDISADLYGGKLILESRIDPARDALEHRVVMEAHKRGLPVLGICRGAQMLNVALEGNLVADIYERYGNAKRIWTALPSKTVTVEPDTRLATIVGTAPLRVNALHTQAVDRVGAGLRIVAHDEFGIVQAVERVAPSFMLGVQWHPEHLFYAARHRALFKALIAAAHAYTEGRDQAQAATEAVAAG